VGVTSTSPLLPHRDQPPRVAAQPVDRAQVVGALIWNESSYTSRLRGSSWSTSSLRPQSRSYLWTSSPVWAI